MMILLCSVLGLASTAKCAEVERADADVIPTREELRLQLRPLTDEELKKQADAWQVRVQKKVAEVSQLQLEKKPNPAKKIPLSCDNSRSLPYFLYVELRFVPRKITIA